MDTSNLCPTPLHGRKWRHLAGAGVPRSKKGRAPQKFEVRLHSFLGCEYNEMWCTWCISRSKLGMYKTVIFVCCIFFGCQGHEDFAPAQPTSTFHPFSLHAPPFSPPKWHPWLRPLSPHGFVVAPLVGSVEIFKKFIECFVGIFLQQLHPAFILPEDTDFFNNIFLYWICRTTSSHRPGEQVRLVSTWNRGDYNSKETRWPATLCWFHKHSPNKAESFGVANGKFSEVVCLSHSQFKWSPRVLIKSQRTSMYLKKLRVLGQA